jgi:hypothetical protein
MTIKEALENALPWTYIKVTYDVDVDNEKHTVVHCTLNRLIVAECKLEDGKLFDDGSKKHPLQDDNIWVWDIKNKDYVVLDCAEGAITEFEFMFLPHEVGPNYFTNPKTDTESKEVFEYVRNVEDYVSQCTDYLNQLSPGSNIEQMHAFPEEHNRETYKVMDVKWSEVYSPTDDTIQHARVNWMKAIVAAKDEAIVYLNDEITSIIAEDGTDEEIEAIEDIKTLLNDLPSEIDLDIHTTLHDIGKFWPPLLLPAPEFIIK